MIVCEIGLNHLGDSNYSNKYAQILSHSKCDSFTYQIREPDFYKGDFSDFELDFEHYESVIDKTSKQVGIALCDLNLLDDCEKAGFSFYKILSWHLNDYKFIETFLNRTDKNIFVSTGTSSLDEVLSFGRFFEKKWSESIDRISLVYTHLNRNTKCSMDLELVNILQSELPFNVGYGNHSNDISLIYKSTEYNPTDIWFYVKSNASTQPDLRSKLIGESHSHPDEEWAVDLDLLGQVINSIEN